MCLAVRLAVLGAGFDLDSGMADPVVPFEIVRQTMKELIAGMAGGHHKMSG